MDPAAFPEPPVRDKYGYRRGNWTYDCTRERLIFRLEQDKEKAISLVWTPDSAHQTVPEEHPWLFDAVLAREEAHLWKAFRYAAFNTVIMGGLALLNSMHPGRSAQFQILILVCAGVIPLTASFWRLYRLEKFTAETMAGRIAEARYRAWMARRSTPWTWGLLGCIGSVAFAQYLILPWMSVNPMREPILAAGIVKDAVRSGEWWRLFTGTFLHGNPFHLFFNVAALIELSTIVEATFHRMLVPLVFTVAAFSGSIFSLIFLPDKTSVGSSGGIMGLLGFTLIVALLQRQHIPAGLRRSLVLSVLMIAGTGLAAYEIIDNAAHLGGLLAGAALALGIVGKQTAPYTVNVSRRVAAASIVSCCVLALTTILCLYKFFSH